MTLRSHFQQWNDEHEEEEEKHLYISYTLHFAMEMIEKKCMVKGCDNMVYVDDSSHFLVICPKHRKGLDNNSR